jgi:hypothetical protein
MSALRKSSAIGQKEIAFKDFRHGPSRRMLPAYLRLKLFRIVHALPS